MIYVDEANWNWRNQRWAHLISDSCSTELHDFAETIGKRRVGFQGDHYDVTKAERERALAAGAVSVGAREIVRLLATSGLRRREPKPLWRSLASGSFEVANLEQIFQQLRCDDGTERAGAVSGFVAALLERLEAATARVWEVVAPPRESSAQLRADLLVCASTAADPTAKAAALLLTRSAANPEELTAHSPLGATASELGAGLGVSELRCPKLVEPNPLAPELTAPLLCVDLLTFGDQAAEQRARQNRDD